MKRKISLDTNEINNLIEELNDYADGLADKCRIFIWRLANEGIKVVKSTYGTGLGDSEREPEACYFKFNDDGEVIGGKLIVKGKDILFIEFGAGIRFNKGNIHPMAHEMGYGVGSYPNQKHAYDPNGWYYRDKNDSTILHHSLGTEATMPVYKASLEIMDKFEEIAEEVFGG